MSLVVSQTGPGGRVGELALWSVAGLLMLSVHLAAAALLMKESPDAATDNAPPAAIMIELAPEPEAAKTDEEQIAPDAQEQEEVRSDQLDPSEDPLPQPDPLPEQTPEPVEPLQELPEPIVEQPAAEEPQPTPQLAEPLHEPQPEPVEQIEPLEQQMTAALENVEVPLPLARPQPRPVEKAEPRKPETRKEPIKRTQRPKEQQARQEMAEARVQAKQSNRTAASQTSTGSIAPSISPAKWKSRVSAKLARNARRCPGNATGTAAVRFSFDGSGNVTNVSLSRSSGNSSIDNYIVSAVRRASPIPAPPSGVARYLDQALTCQ